MLIESAKVMLATCCESDPPSPFTNKFRFEIIFYRVVEMQIEQCEALIHLRKLGLFRPAYAVLRSLLENMTTLVWISKDVNRYGNLFEKGKQPNMRSRLERIGWQEEYERTFSYLSGFVHTAIEHVEDYRDYALSEGALFPEIVPDAEYYAIQTDEGQLVPLAIKPMPPEKISSLYAPYLEAKTFDIAISGLWKLYKGVEGQASWWPSDDTLSTFSMICRNNKELAGKMLWESQPRLF
ncbi:hypothetical protein [Candidatus Leptofilum sp.]|uniref:hypothetical protein n=1 Tax=Candidatus Leptofilum sp. TaxID=3241576 RepID=UPI003B5A7EE2